MKQLLQLFKSHTLEFVSKTHRGQNAYSFNFKNPGLDYEAGQHVFFTIPHTQKDSRGTMRIFSVSSNPSHSEISFTTRIPDSKPSSYKKALWKLQPGDKIIARGPSPVQDVYKINDYDRYYVYIVGGIGITPLHSILLDSIDRNKDLKATLLYCNRTKDIIFEQEIHEARKTLKNFDAQHIISPERIPLKTIQDLYDTHGDNAVFVISGTRPFTDNYKNLCKESGVKSKNIKAYKFHSPFSSY